MNKPLTSLDELLSYHRPGWVVGRDYYAGHVLHLYLLGLPWQTPTYPKEWFAGIWEREAIRIIHEVLDIHGTVTPEAFASTLVRATPEAERAYPGWSKEEVLQYRYR